MSTDVPVAASGPAAALWDWSLATYGRPGFSAAALELQDRHGFDVNILLYCLWAGVVHEVSLGAAGVLAAMAATRDWQAGVVLPLRAARRQLKTCAHPDPERVAALRRRVADAELDAEQGEQALLADLPLPAAGAAGPLAAAAGNLRAYARAVGPGAGSAAAGPLALALALAADSDAAEASRQLGAEPRPPAG